MIRRRGFTLIEAVATIVVLGIIGSIASHMVLSAAEGYVDAATVEEMHTSASVALDRSLRELRGIRRKTSATTLAPDVDAVVTDGISWHSDSRLALTGTTLELTVRGGPAAPLLRDVTSFRVQAYDRDNQPLAATLNGPQCDPIRRIELTITVSRAGLTDTLRSRVFVRSMMEGFGS